VSRGLYQYFNGKKYTEGDKGNNYNFVIYTKQIPLAIKVKGITYTVVKDGSVITNIKK